MNSNRYVVGIRHGLANLTVVPDSDATRRNFVVLKDGFATEQAAEDWKDRTQSQVDAYNRVHCETCDD